ncbi:hypothetical protein J2S16_001292 [Cytobacillus kochii]|nr:hypothetical protein [Cytobacillus kochii]
MSINIQLGISLLDTKKSPTKAAITAASLF